MQKGIAMSDAGKLNDQVYEAYDNQCQREGVVDFAELTLRTYELLRDNTSLREHY